jgi:hypothetical protein
MKINVPSKAGKIRTHAQKDSFDVIFDSFFKRFSFIVTPINISHISVL